MPKQSGREIFWLFSGVRAAANLVCLEAELTTFNQTALRACITGAALDIKESRALARPVQGRRNQKPYNAIVEIDVSVAGRSSTYIFNCISNAGLVVIQPMSIR